MPTSNRKKKKKEKAERRIRGHLYYAIASFDKVKAEHTTQWLYSSTDKQPKEGFEPDVVGEPRKYWQLRHIELPKLLEKYRKNGRITQDQYDNLILQLNAVDREDWFLAFVLTKQYIFEKKLKHKK